MQLATVTPSVEGAVQRGHVVPVVLVAATCVLVPTENILMRYSFAYVASCMCIRIQYNFVNSKLEGMGKSCRVYIRGCIAQDSSHQSSS